MRITKAAAIVPFVLLLVSVTAAYAKEARASIRMPQINDHLHQERLTLAQTDPHEFLQAALKNHQRFIRDYRCLFVKQELIKGKLTKEQHIRVKFCEEPFSVFMKWVKNPGRVDRVLYVKGRHDNNLLAKPAGLLGKLVRTHVKRPVNGPDAAKVSRRTLDQFGFANALKLMIDTNIAAAKVGELNLKFKKQSKLNGRRTFVFERILPNKRKYPEQRLLVHIDQQWMVPTGIYAFDAKGRLLGKYEYRNVELNVGLGWKEFTPRANGL